MEDDTNQAEINVPKVHHRFSKWPLIGEGEGSDRLSNRSQRGLDS